MYLTENEAVIYAGTEWCIGAFDTDADGRLSVELYQKDMTREEMDAFENDEWEVPIAMVSDLSLLQKVA